MVIFSMIGPNWVVFAPFQDNIISGLAAIRRPPHFRPGHTMNIEAEALADGVWKINLTGRMDIQGTQVIDTKFSGMTGGGRNAIVVDMSGVDFLASIGIRTLVLNGKAVGQR